MSDTSVAERPGRVGEPRAEKVAVVEEVRTRLSAASAAILTEYRDDRKGGNVQVPIGKASFSRRQLLENFRAVIDELQRAKPAAAKGRYMQAVTLSSSQGPGVRVDPARLRLTEEDLAA